ncbi:MAG: DNA replication and repair protein RecF [Synergistaceae bacterium]|jgi:DNA replication and repair protein RecF|nr:DNA replication and repair protein RecF [Synergistaceae bacterium]
MYFSGTYFHNFRNIGAERRKWPPGFNMISGPNGSGKTNFMEGLNILSGWGPLDKNSRIANLIRWREKEGELKTLLWGCVEGEESTEVFVSLRTRSQLKCDGKTIGAAEMRRKIPVLAFLPGHMSLISGGASYRRRLLDITGALVEMEYARILNDYRTVLKQKAALLKKRSDTKAADRILASLGSWLWESRGEILNMIVSEIKKFAQLFHGKVDIFFVRGGGGMDEVASEDFRKSLIAAKDRETRSGIPLVGPQRDDIRIDCDGMGASVALSRGQGRKLAVALILAAARVVERCLARKPVLLFDEIYSELDAEGREYVIDALISTGCQVFASTAEASPRDGFDIFKMRDGRFSRHEA